MYGLPDSAVVGTAKRFSGSLRRVRDYERNEHWLEWLSRKCDDWFPIVPDGLKEARQEFFETHGYYPPGDPRE